MDLIPRDRGEGFLVVVFFAASMALLVCQDIAPETVVVTIDDVQITDTEVLYFLNNRLPKRGENGVGPLDDRLKAEAARQLVKRRLVYAALKSKKRTVDPKLVQYRIQQFEKKLGGAELDLAAYLAEKRLTRAQFEFENDWQLSWTKYIERAVTDDKLEKHFQRYARQFDGTQLDVAHIIKLFPADLKRRDAFIKSQIAALTKLRAQLTAGDVQWKEAAETHSGAPSRKSAGALGWIGYDGPMAADFNHAAFKLNMGEISPPVVTQFGVHLIRCNSVRPGKVTFRDAYEKVKSDALRREFERLARAGANQSNVIYSTDWPHFDEKGNLVKPAR